MAYTQSQRLTTDRFEVRKSVQRLVFDINIWRPSLDKLFSKPVLDIRVLR